VQQRILLTTIQRIAEGACFSSPCRVKAQSATAEDPGN
jgi:hypothetical protein